MDMVSVAGLSDFAADELHFLSVVFLLCSFSPIGSALSLYSTDRGSGPDVTRELNDTERSSFRSYNDNRSRGSCPNDQSGGR
ncbi:hypothetical protein V6N11_036574 [Hibiscus sabdariffa]|uniref:Uncharacterized protein n=1 Tax=Hibiscus sabdariffa TaxID=183260 RepID=A0ABR2RBK7_9ROSI